MGFSGRLRAEVIAFGYEKREFDPSGKDGIQKIARKKYGGFGWPTDDRCLNAKA
jgi:hypothetical protein